MFLFFVGLIIGFSLADWGWDVKTENEPFRKAEDFVEEG